MAEEINFIYERVQDLANKDEASGYISPEEFNREIKQAQMDEIVEQRKMFESGYISTDNIAPLKKETTLFIPSSGAVAKPSDYLFFDTANLEYFYKDASGNQIKSISGVDIIPDSELPKRLTSQIKSVNEKHPVGVIRGDNFYFYPQAINKIKLFYIARPNDPNWTYDEVDGDFVFDPTDPLYQNVSLPWQLVPNLIRRVCSQLGVSLRQGDLVQIMEQKMDKNNI